MNILIFIALLQIKLFSIFQIRKLLFNFLQNLLGRFTWDESPKFSKKWENKFSVRDFKLIVDGWHFHLNCFVVDNFVVRLLEEENTISFLSFLFCFHCYFSKLTACRWFSVAEIQNNFKIGSPCWLSLCFSLSVSVSLAYEVCTYVSK